MTEKKLRVYKFGQQFRMKQGIDLKDGVVEVESGYLTGLRAQRRMRESEKGKFSSGNINSIFQHILESFMKDSLIRDPRIESDRLTILITELDSEEIFMVILIFSKNSVIRFRLWAKQVYAGRGNLCSVYNGDIC